MNSSQKLSMLEKKNWTVLESELNSAQSYEEIFSILVLFFLMRQEKQTKKLFPKILKKNFF